MKKILVPIDGSSHSNLALEKAEEFAKACGGDITLLHVNDFSEHMFHYDTGLEESFVEAFNELSEDILKEGKEKLAELGDRVKVVKLDGTVSRMITQYANQGDFDLVIIGSHGKGMIHEFVMGGVAHKVILHVNKPVLVVK